MNNFIVLFEEKEGTSPLVRLLDNFERVSVVHHENGGAGNPSINTTARTCFNGP
jgi:hypothetical protein